MPVVDRGDGNDGEDIDTDFDTWKASLLMAIDDSALLAKRMVRQPLGTLALALTQSRSDPDVALATFIADCTVCPYMPDECDSLMVIIYPCREVGMREMTVVKSLQRSCLHTMLSSQTSRLM